MWSTIVFTEWCSGPDKICYILNFEMYIVRATAFLMVPFILFASLSLFFFCCCWTTDFIYLFFRFRDICTYFKVSKCFHIVIVSMSLFKAEIRISKAFERKQNFHMHLWLFLVIVICYLLQTYRPDFNRFLSWEKISIPKIIIKVTLLQTAMMN